MRYARFRTAAGQFCEGLLSSEGEFIGGETAEAEATVLASERAALSAIVGEALEPVVTDADPWDGVSPLITLPAPPAPPPVPIESMTAAEIAASSTPPGPLETIKTILAKADADITAAEVKTLVLLMARYFYRKWLNGWR